MSAVEPDGEWPDHNSGDTVRHRLRRWGRLGGFAIALGMSLAFAAAAWYALQRSDMRPTVIAEVPLVKAAPGPVKEKPEDPGGLTIPNQDKLVFERITPKPSAPVVEKLAPAPEEPIVKAPAPAAPVIANAPAAPAIADAPANAPGDAAKPETSKGAAAPKAMAKQAAMSPASPGAAGKRAAPPAIPGAANAAMASRVESLLPAAGGALKTTANKATLPTPPAPQAKALPDAMAKVSIAAPVKAPEIKAPVGNAPAAKTVKSDYRIQMVAYRKEKLADAAWRRLQKEHAGILGDLSGHTARVDLGKRGVYYRVQAGFFGNAAKARSACGKLKAKRQDCIIVPPQ